MVIARLRSRSWETPEGERRSVTEVEAEEVGPSLKFAIAKGIAAYRGRAIALRVPSPESPAEGLAVWGLVEQAGNFDRQALRSLISTGRWRVGRGTTLKRST